MSSGERLLVLDSPSSPPGDALIAYGYGCSPRAPVTLDVAKEAAGRTTATPDGTFAASLSVPDLAVGQYEVVARCGPILTTALGVVLTSNADPATSTLVVLTFFVLLGLAVVRRQFA